MTIPSPTKEIHLDGSTLEAGSQLIRNALTLSALTSRPVTIHSTRANRPGKGLKAMHLPPIRFIAEISNSVVEGAEVGSSRMSFCPPEKRAAVKGEYVFEMKKQRSVGLVLQAIYLFLLCAGAAKGPIKLDIIGGTNVQKSPPFEYISQVFAPNLKFLEFSELSVGCLIHPLPSTDGKPDFPPLNLNNYGRGKVTKIDITVLAPDTRAWWPTTRPLGSEEVLTLRKYIEHETIVKLREELNHIPSHIIDADVSISIHYSEATHHPPHVYIMIVGHTTTGFRIARDSLLNLEIYFRFKEDKKDPDDYRDHEKMLIWNTIEKQHMLLSPRTMR